jgi:vancomycin resistance protein YoaR
MAVITREQHRGARLRALSWHVAIVPLALACVTLATFFAADELYAERALPGLTIGGVSVGSLDRAALHQRLESELAGPWASGYVTATLEDRTWTASNADLGVNPDVDAAAAAALSYGKTGSVLDRADAWIDALRGEARIPFALRARGDALERWIAMLSAAAERPAVAGELAVTPRGLVATEPVIGRALDRTATSAAILAADSLGDRTVALRVRPVYPAIDDSGFRAAYERARAVVTPLVVTVEDRNVTEDPAGLSGLLSIERTAARPGDLPAVPADAVAPSARYRYVVTLNEQRLGEWASALATKLDRPAKSAKYAATREGVLTVIPGAAGIKLEPQKTVAFLGTELLKPAGDTRWLAVPAVIDVPAFTTEQAKDWLPKVSRTSTFTTNFPPNASRHANIATGASQFDGVVVAPGATFSFWELLGPVNVERGYAYAGAIINNRSDENVIGGGLCQVSTTMFNALAKQGYEIVERHAHGYLIERYPIGLDAAVFDPGYDFRWRNDTAAPVFLWSWVSDTSVTFDVWSVPTGREVTFSDAVQRNFVDVPPTQPADPAFAAGYKVLGRDVFRTRTVLDGGKVLHQDTFASHYAPVWGGPLPQPAP